MKQFKIIPVITLFFLTSFNIVDKLTTPFVDERIVESEISKPPPPVFTSHSDIAIIIILAIIIFSFSSTGYGYKQRYGYNNQMLIKTASEPSFITEAAVKLFQKVFEKKYFQFTEKDLQQKDEQISKLLASNGIDPLKIKEFAKAALKELANFFSGKESKLSEITLKPLYTKLYPNYQVFMQKFKNSQPGFFYLVNFRYSEHEKAFSVYSRFIFHALDGNVYENGYFITFVENEGFKISAIENENESYVMKLESFFSAKSKINFLNYQKIKSLNLELKFAEIFYEIYSWWKGEKDAILKNLFLNEDVYLKLIEAKQRIEKNKTEFYISEIKISNIEILNIREEFSDLSLTIIARVVFYIKGRFAKNSMIIIDEEKLSDEIWEFKVKEEKILLSEILKKEGRIEQNPLQIEWHL